MLIRYSILALTILCFSCSTTVSVPHKLQKGETVFIAPFDVNLSKRKSSGDKDTVCACINENLVSTLTPYLQSAGFKIFTIPYNKTPKKDFELKRIADSADARYILKGNGIIHVVGSSSFVDQLTFTVFDLTEMQPAVTVTFAGSATRPIGAAHKAGKKLVKKLD